MGLSQTAGMLPPRSKSYKPQREGRAGTRNGLAVERVGSKLAMRARRRQALLPEKVFYLIHPAFGARIVVLPLADGFQLAQQLFLT
jgi:hypothetical protein